MAPRVPFSRPPVLLVAHAFGTWLSQALANLVKARGYRVHFVVTGRELLDLAPTVQPDAIVLDA
ncbi:MAG: response regulator, partial [Gemmatimonadetes bacterium]